MAYSHGELINYANIARDCAVNAKTVKEYYQIMADTLMGSFVEPFARRQGRQVISKASKFYLFDVGVAGAMIKRSIAEERGEQFGKALEHFIFMELTAHRSYTGRDYPINFWRTKTGLEVDFVLGGGEIAIEVKGTSKVSPSDTAPVNAFIEEFHPKQAIIVCNERAKRKTGNVYITPWRTFLEELWQGKII